MTDAIFPKCYTYANLRNLYQQRIRNKSARRNMGDDKK